MVDKVPYLVNYGLNKDIFISDLTITNHSWNINNDLKLDSTKKYTDFKFELSLKDTLTIKIIFIAALFIVLILLLKVKNGFKKRKKIKNQTKK